MLATRSKPWTVLCLAMLLGAPTPPLHAGAFTPDNLDISFPQFSNAPAEGPSSSCSDRCFLTLVGRSAPAATSAAPTRLGIDCVFAQTRQIRTAEFRPTVDPHRAATRAYALAGAVRFQIGDDSLPASPEQGDLLLCRAVGSTFLGTADRRYLRRGENDYRNAR